MKARPESSRNHVPTADELSELTAQLAGLMQLLASKHSYSELERRTGIDRTKLRDIAQGDEKKLTLVEILALDSLLGGRFADALRGTNRSLIDELHRASRITFILGARELHWADHVSRWDVKAMTSLLHSIYERAGEAPEIRVDSVLQRPVNGTPLPEYMAQVAQEPWCEQLDAQNQDAFVVLGSPRASHVAEYVLCKMFEEEPFSQPKKQLPFSFLWNAQLHRELPSAFSTITKGPRQEPPSGIVGLRVDGVDHFIDDQQSTWLTFGIGAMQRRQSGQLWLVAAGATGTATAAVAAAISEIRGAILPQTAAGPSPVLWFAVQAEVKREGQRGGDNRVLLGDEVLGEPTLWDPTTGQSRPLRSAPPPPQRHHP